MILAIGLFMMLVGTVLVGMGLDARREPTMVPAAFGPACKGSGRPEGIRNCSSRWQLWNVASDLDLVLPVTLTEGYHKAAVVWCGSQAVVSCFDSGSYRNLVQDEMLAQIEADSPGTVMCRRPCEPTRCDGFASGGSVTYKEVAVIKVKFREKSHQGS